MKRKKYLFTIIELLVVIAIIAILSSILLPALNSAREKGRTATCLSLMRNVVNGAVLYSIDWNDYFPFRNSSAAKYWASAEFAGYCGVSSLNSYSPDEWNRKYLCPNFRYPSAGQYYSVLRVYPMNHIDIAQSTGENAYKLTKVKRPGSKLAFLEAASYGSFPTTSSGYEYWGNTMYLIYGDVFQAASSKPHVAYRHGGRGQGTVAAYFDVHMSTLNPASVWKAKENGDIYPYEK